MDNINSKTLGKGGGTFFIKAIRNCVLPQQKNTPPLWIDTFVPSTYKHRLV